MGSLTDYAELELLDHVCNAAYSPLATVYLALATADPTDAATGASMNECPDANAYARTAITFAAYADFRVTQTGAVAFPAASGGGWGTVSHWTVVDTDTYGTGNVLAHGAFGASKTVNEGNTPSVPTAEVYVEITEGEFSDYLVQKLLELMFRNQAYAAPDTYIALCTATVTGSHDGDTITEPGAGAYAREQVEPNGGSAPTWDVATGTTPAEVDNGEAITFTTATASWGTIVAVAICDALASGNLLYFDNAMADQAVGDGDTAEFAIGALDIQLT